MRPAAPRRGGEENGRGRPPVTPPRGIRPSPRRGPRGARRQKPLPRPTSRRPGDARTATIAAGRVVRQARGRKIGIPPGTAESRRPASHPCGQEGGAAGTRDANIADAAARAAKSAAWEFVSDEDRKQDRKTTVITSRPPSPPRWKSLTPPPVHVIRSRNGLGKSSVTRRHITDLLALRLALSGGAWKSTGAEPTGRKRLSSSPCRLTNSPMKRHPHSARCQPRRGRADSRCLARSRGARSCSARQENVS